MQGQISNLLERIDENEEEVDEEEDEEEEEEEDEPKPKKARAPESPVKKGSGGGRAPKVDRLVPGSDAMTVYEDYTVKLNQTNIGG